MHWWEMWRIFNVVLAVASVQLNAYKGVRVRIWGYLDLDDAIGFLARLAWPSCYAVAAIWAQAQGVAAGPWTALMTVPIVWTLVAAVVFPEAKRARVTTK